MPQQTPWAAPTERVPLGHWPTPLEPLERLSAELGGPKIWIKRDDCSGLAGGGNKTRKLEFLLGQAQQEGADSVITFGAVQSNHARQTAAACAKLGLECHLILTRRVATSNAGYETLANIFLDRLLNATVHISNLEEADATLTEVQEALASAGRRTYLIPPGGSNAVGALGYVSALVELQQQCQAQQLQLTQIVHASASAGTQAGLVYGCSACAPQASVMGINVFHADPSKLEQRVKHITDELHTLTAQFAKQAVSADQIHVNHAYLGAGYGHPTPATVDGIKLLAELEGILFDPVYSGKALAALIDQINLGNFDAHQDVILLHTGGATVLDVYAESFTE